MKKTAKHHRTRKDVLLTACIGAVALALFYYIAVSQLSNWLKAPALIAVLVGSGLLMQKIAGFEGYYGLLVFRGEKGFRAMRYAAEKFGGTARKLADFGLSLGFGLLYSYYLFGRKDFKKFLAHAAAVTAFFLLVQPGVAKNVAGFPEIVFAFNLAFGLLAFGVQSLVIQGTKILTTSNAPAGAALIIPGITIPWEGLIALVIAIAVHEIAHGILCMVEKLEVKNSGAVLFGILPIAAFVEPNEEKLKDLEIHKKRRILVAGITSNFFVFVIFLLFAQLAALGLAGFETKPAIVKVLDTGTAAGILQDNEVILAVNGAAVESVEEFAAEMKKMPEGNKAVLKTSLGEKTVVAGKDGKIGISVADKPAAEDAFAYGIMAFLFIVFNLTALINFALATINLLPIFFTDGYRLFYEEARHAFPSAGDLVAKRIAVAAGVVSVLLILINFIPSFR